MTEIGGAKAIEDFINKHPRKSFFALGVLAGGGTTATAVKASGTIAPYLYANPGTFPFAVFGSALVGTLSSVWTYDICIRMRNKRTQAKSKK